MKDLGRDESVGRLLERALRSRQTANRDDCPGADMLAAWSEGALTASEQASVDAHAADCAPCQAQLAAIARMMPTEIPQSAFQSPLKSAIQSAIRNPQSAIRWFVPATAAAAALAIWVWVQPPPRLVTQQAAVPQPTQTAPAAAPPAPAGAPLARFEARPRVDPPALVEAQAQAKPSAARAAAPREEMRAADSIVAERQAEQSAASNRVRPGAPPAEAARQRASGFSPTIAPQQRRAVLADAAAERPLEIASPDAAVRWRVSGPTILRSIDAGATWQPQSAGVDARFTAGASPRPTVCWLVGRGGVVLLSIDGQTWRRVPFPEAVDLVGVTASSASVASVTTADGRVLATSDGGATWLAVP